MTLVYVDTETTGLNPAVHEVWELAWAVDDGEIQHGTVPHSLARADEGALAINNYHARVSSEPWADETAAMVVLRGSTLVAANPAFDTAFLRVRWGWAPWKYRLLDIEAYAMGALGYDVPQGLKTVADDLRRLGYDVPQSDHTAAADVACLRACHRALRGIYLDASLVVFGRVP